MAATLILGGIRSGKSRYAESLLDSGAPARYVATGVDGSADAEWSARIQAHRTRRPSHWVTVETRDVAAELTRDPVIDTLVDDIGSWLTSALDRTGAWERGTADLLTETDELLSAVSIFTGQLILVSPEVGLTVVPATRAGRLFADALGTLNQQLADRCDRVFLVVAGQPMTVKEPK